MNTSETLHKAADLIEERGWGQGPSSWRAHTGGPVCIEGAIGAAMGRVMQRPGDPAHISAGDIQECPAGAAVRAFLGERRLGFGNWLCHWNDFTARNAAEVIEVLRATAAVEELKEAEARGPLKTGPTVRVPTQPGVGVA